MSAVAGLLVAIVIHWVILLVVIPIADRMADFSMPERWPVKLLGVVVVTNVIVIGLAPLVAPLVAMLAGAAVFWFGLWKVFEIDLMGAVIITVISWLIRGFAFAAIAAAMAGG